VTAGKIVSAIAADNAVFPQFSNGSAIERREMCASGHRVGG
jgi:hypothetical protein